MKLVLAEKPSVAQSIAKVLGVAKREDGYLEGNGYVVSWCVGHLVELAQPEAYDAKYSKWAYADLPIFPMDWQYEVSAGTKKQFGILKKLMAREDVASLVCATDAGREGELIFRLVYHKAGCRKPFERLWISSMEDVAIKEGFENLRSGTEYDALYEAALCRERADWIVGINATRLFSTLYGQTLNVGRVMTPTLAMAVMREAAISAFKPEPFYTVQIGLDGFTASSERYTKKSEAETICNGCSVAIVTKAECKEKTEKPPALYDLTSLQREANRVLGYTAQQTLDYTQNLYEKKLVTYPRTDSRFLTEDMAHSLPDLVKLAFHAFPVEDVDNVPVHAEQVSTIQTLIKNGHTDEALSFTQKLTESIAVEMSAINTNHPVVNAILNQKYRSMQEKHIAVILKVGDLQEICLEEEEIVILLSNLLDNAIRESEKVLKNTGKAVIHLKLECEDHKLIFAVRNPVTEKVEIENDTIKSKRGDHHGIGLLNVKAVVDKYGGDMVLSCDENEFKAVVIL